MTGEKKTLIRWLIEQADGEAYRAGRASGKRHPKVDHSLMRILGGRDLLLSQAREIERDEALGGSGQIWFDWCEMNTNIRQIHYSADLVPALCRREGMEDPRERQIRYIQILRKWSERAAGTWLAVYYRDEIEKLEAGHCSGMVQSDMKNEHLYRCLDALVHLKRPLEKPIFSGRVFRGVSMPEEGLTPTKIFAKKYQARVIRILKQYAPDYAEGMSDDETLAACGILSYSQTLEWKGPLVYLLDTGQEIDSAGNIYGTIINAQTLEHVESVRIPEVKRIMVIENKANYEKLDFRPDELYIFCHGFFSPKEVRFLKRLEAAADGTVEYFHWGDMDYGGIRIFQFNQARVFPRLKPYQMDRRAYEAGIAAGAGTAVETEKRRKLEAIDGGELEELRQCILKYGMELEQELLADQE